MKIPPEKLKPFSSDIAPDCLKLIANLRNSGDVTKFTTGLDNITEWCSVFGKTEMGRWADVLNDCDAVLETATSTDENETLRVDADDSLEAPLVSVLRFTSLLFENSFSRSIYSSTERLIKLLDSRKIWVVVQTLRLLMIISKSSRFLAQHLGIALRTDIHNKLTAILECWGNKLKTISFAEFCSEDFPQQLPPSFSNINFRNDIDGFNIDQNKTLTESIADLKAFLSKPSLDLQPTERISAFTRLRFFYSIRNESNNERYYQVMARLISTSIIFYSRCLLGDESRLNILASDQYIEQCCQVLHFVASPKYQHQADAIKTESLKTLASMVFLEKPKKIQLIADSLELKIYHGFCPALLRNCIERLKTGRMEAIGEFSYQFVTGLFSLIYHIAGFEYGSDALNRSSTISSLLGLVKTYDLPDHFISYVTRSIRIIDILTGNDVTEFNSNDGTEAVIRRFTYEIDQCKSHMETAQTEGTPFLCNQQRSALIKSILNFLKRAVLDVNLSAQMRRIMESQFPNAIMHVISNPQYYGSTLLQCAILLVTNFIYQEPAQLAMLQTKGLTDAVLQLIFNPKFPVTRDLVCALPALCSALCLNERGLNEVKSYNDRRPLEKIFRVIFSNKFLLSMRKRKTEILDTAHMLGGSFDELVRHQPGLRKEVMGTLGNIIDDLLEQCRGDRNTVISWSIGKNTVEEDLTVEHLPLGDYLAILGVMLETMLTNRGIHDNVQVLNEFGIPIKLVKLLSQAKNPNPVLLNSNYLPHLASILCCVMRQLTKIDDAFVHLVESCAKELDEYASIKEDPKERLCQLTRLSSLISTMNNLMKSVIQTQSSYDVRPFMLHYFATKGEARHFVTSLFDTFKLMSTDKLLSAAQQTTSQILEDATKVSELLRIDDELNGQADMAMDVDDTQSIGSAATYVVSLTQNTAMAMPEPIHSSTPNSLLEQPQTSSTNSTIAAGIPSSSNSNSNLDTTERSISQVACRSQRQIAELITCIGRNFCNANITKARQRAAQNQQINQSTLKKDFRVVSKMIFGGMKKLLQTSEHNKINNIPSTNGTQFLNLLKKLLFDDPHSLQQLLPDFYLSGCHQAYFAIIDESSTSNLTKSENMSTIQTWLTISHKLFSSNILADPKQSRNGALRIPVEGFELKHYLAKAQKDTFHSLCHLFKALVATCSELPIDPPNELKERHAQIYKLLEKFMECLRLLLKDMLKLLALTDGKNEQQQEVPVNEIDPQKIQQLVEMGFSQSESLDALLQYSSVPEAAEYLVSMMERTIARQASPAVTVSVSHSMASVQTAVATQSAESQHTEEMPVSDDQQPTSSVVKEEKPFAELKALSAEEMQERVQHISEAIVTSCLGLIGKNRAVVNGLAELVTVFAEDQIARNWVLLDFIERLKNDLCTQMDKLQGESENPESVQHTAAMMHLFNLIWQNFPNQNIYKNMSDGTAGDEEFTLGLDLE